MGKFLSILLAALLALTGCGRRQPVSADGFLLNTYVSVKLYDGDLSDAQAALDLCRDYEKLFSRTDPSSQLCRLNRREIASVDPELAQVIQLGLDYSRLSGGAFDVTMGSVTELWDFSSQEPFLPDQADIAQALTHAGWEKVSVEGNTVLFSDPETKLDLGAIAKGYIADRMAEELQNRGVSSAILDLGGNLYCLGTKPGGKSFQVGVQYPYLDRSQVLGTLPAADQSVVTSGVYERYIQVDGREYHHILDTTTGWPVENGLVSVTILSDRSADGDALSTACFALGLEEGLALVEALDGVEALFVTEDLAVHPSSGMEALFTPAK